jgi:hypothetical protein
MRKFGFREAEWTAIKQEARAILVDRARLRGCIPYSDLADRIQTIQLEAHDPRLFHLLGEISTEEDRAGRGMLTVIVVHKDGDMQPGPGFFELARRLGRDTSDILVCWISELKKVHAYWSRGKASGVAPELLVDRYFDSHDIGRMRKLVEAGRYWWRERYDFVCRVSKLPYKRATSKERNWCKRIKEYLEAESL